MTATHLPAPVKMVSLMPSVQPLTNKSSLQNVKNKNPPLQVNRGRGIAQFFYVREHQKINYPILWDGQDARLR
jgi:hypothetical protein